MVGSEEKFCDPEAPHLCVYAALTAEGKPTGFVSSGGRRVNSALWMDLMAAHMVLAARFYQHHLDSTLDAVPPEMREGVQRYFEERLQNAIGGTDLRIARAEDPRPETGGNF